MVPSHARTERHALTVPIASIPAQRDLFDTRPWKPLKPVRYSPENLLALIHAMSSRGRQCFASAAWFAHKFSVSARTIGRWLLELGPRVLVTTRPGRTSLFCAGAVEKMSRVDVLPPQVSPCINSSSRLKAESPTLPAKVSAVLERAAGRISRAKNPAAYRQSIISTELRLFARAEAEAEAGRGAILSRPASKPAASEVWSSQGAPDCEIGAALRALGESKRLA